MTGTGRSCGTCSLCCKVMAVPGVAKPAHQWCQHIVKRQGCGIYEKRPEDCRIFHCMYLTSAIGEHWFPANSKMIPVSVPHIPRIEVQVDGDRPNAWQRQPYYDDLKAWARNAAEAGGQVMICLPDRSIIIMPDEDIDVGKIAPDEVVHIRREPGPDGQIKANVIKEKRPPLPQ